MVRKYQQRAEKKSALIVAKWLLKENASEKSIINVRILSHTALYAASGRTSVKLTRRRPRLEHGSIAKAFID